MTLVDDPNLEKPGPVITLDITGMHCAACVSSVEDALLSSPDVIHARVSLASQHAVVQLLNEDVNVEGVWKSGATRGYGACQSAGKVEAIRNLDAQYKAEAFRWFVRWVSGVCLFIITMVMHLNEQLSGEVT
ncbi:MAG: cation transporter, partial [Pirellulales bacterium]|nr:cation transporter [Pirellulales bacterium]